MTDDIATFSNRSSAKFSGSTIGSPLPQILGKIQDSKERTLKIIKEIQDAKDQKMEDYDHRDTCLQFQKLPDDVQLGVQLRLYINYIQEFLIQVESFDECMQMIEKNIHKLEGNMGKLVKKTSVLIGIQITQNTEQEQISE